MAYGVLKLCLGGFKWFWASRLISQKRKFYGLNLEEDFITSTSTFLSCGVGSLPFTFLGVDVGINPRKISTWRETVSKIHSSLSSWKRKFLSQGGRITMINVGLTNILIYLFSFYRAPKAIIQEIIKIQHNFLWWGEEG